MPPEVPLGGLLINYRAIEIHRSKSNSDLDIAGGEWIKVDPSRSLQQEPRTMQVCVSYGSLLRDCRRKEEEIRMGHERGQYTINHYMGAPPHHHETAKI